MGHDFRRHHVSLRPASKAGDARYRTVPGVVRDLNGISRGLEMTITA